MNTEPLCALLVEDDENDVFLMERAMSKLKTKVPIYVVTDGQEAMDYLAGTGQFSDRAVHPLPKCVFLDLKLPNVHGFEVLKWIKGQPDLAQIDIFVLTSSPEERDQKKARELGAKAYLVKPPIPEMLRQVLRPIPGCDLE